jgi:hypothetical protein
MQFAEARRSPGWIVLLATIIGLAFGGYTFISRAQSTHVYVQSCGKLDYKPGVIFKTCADGNLGISNIEWEAWSESGARGKALYFFNNCLPDCANGKRFASEVTVTLTGDTPLTLIDGKRAFNHIAVKARDKKLLPYSSSNTDSWDLA